MTVIFIQADLDTLFLWIFFKFIVCVCVYEIQILSVT